MLILILNIVVLLVVILIVIHVQSLRGTVLVQWDYSTVSHYYSILVQWDIIQPVTQSTLLVLVVVLLVVLILVQVMISETYIHCHDQSLTKAIVLVVLVVVKLDSLYADHCIWVYSHIERIILYWTEMMIFAIFYSVGFFHDIETAEIFIQNRFVIDEIFIQNRSIKVTDRIWHEFLWMLFTMMYGRCWYNFPLH
jgi:hypothetical protein